MTEMQRIQQRLRKAAAIALVVGAAAAALAALGWFVQPGQFFRSWLFGYLLWWEIAMGCLGLAMLHQLTGGEWGTATRPFFEAGVGTLPLLALLFVPVALGLTEIFPWANESWRAEHPLNDSRANYLNPNSFLIRSAIYFGVWIVFGWLLTFRRRRLERSPNGEPQGQLAGLSGLGLVLLVFSVTFASVDWIMSLEPNYRSTMFGGIVMAASAVAGLSFVAASTALIPGRVSVQDEDQGVETFNDLGNLLLAFVMVWTYVVFSQFLITWMGNLPEEVDWYQQRNRGGWQALIVAVLLFHFVLPFFALLFRGVKRAPGRLAAVALLVLFMRLPDNYWLVAPSWAAGGFRMHWLDLVAPLAVGGLWTAAYVRGIRPHLLIPAGDENTSPKPEG